MTIIVELLIDIYFVVISALLVLSTCFTLEVASSMDLYSTLENIASKYFWSGRVSNQEPEEEWSLLATNGQKRICIT